MFWLDWINYKLHLKEIYNIYYPNLTFGERRLGDAHEELVLVLPTKIVAILKIL